MNTPAAPRYLTIPRFSRISGLVHGFGTRHWTLDDLKKEKAGQGFSFVWLSQTHSDRIHFIDEPPRRRLQGDALATDRSGIFLIVKTADCLPVFIADESKGVIAAAHCGWRGTRQRILERLVREIAKRYGCEPASLLAAVGPSIGRACYEVGEDVRRSFKQGGLDEDLFRPRRADKNGKYFLDLEEANRRQLIGQGLRPRNILSVSVCPHCDDRFFSYRRDRDKTARLFSFIGLNR